MKAAQRVYIIAEAGVNHNGSETLAKSMIDCAAEAGADAIKFQSFVADKLVSKSAPSAKYQSEGMGEKTSQWQMLKALEMSESMQSELARYAIVKKIDFLSTPFDEDSLEILLRTTQMSRVKIASGEITNAPLLLRIALTKLPIILSTGMCTLGEIEDALSVLAFGYLTGLAQPTNPTCFKDAYSRGETQAILREKVTILHCTSQYPTDYENANLRAMQTIAAAFGIPVGFSDHTLGTAVSVAAVALGAAVVEKHFTMDRLDKGPDHRMSLEPEELKLLVESIRQVESALGSPIKRPTVSEIELRPIVRKGLTAATTIQQGELFTSENLTVKRPEGILPARLWGFIGKRAPRAYSEDEPLDEVLSGS